MFLFLFVGHIHTSDCSLTIHSTAKTLKVQRYRDPGSSIFYDTQVSSVGSRPNWLHCDIIFDLASFVTEINYDKRILEFMDIYRIRIYEQGSNNLYKKIKAYSFIIYWRKAVNFEFSRLSG